MELTKEDIQKIEDLGWCVEKTEYGYSLRNYSPSDGDMSFDAQSKEDIISYCENFDPEEEFDLWYGVHRGEPTSPSELWRDCMDKQEMYEQLANILK